MIYLIKNFFLLFFFLIFLCSEASPNRCTSRDKKEALFFELKKNVHCGFEAVEKYEDLKILVKQYIAICHKKKCKNCDYLNFLELMLVLLKLLSEGLFAEEREQNSVQTKKASVPKGLLSISQQKIFKKSLQFVVALGILPNLLRGIGIPLSKRLEYAKLLEHFAPDVTPRQKQAQIAICLKTLLCCMERATLQGIIVSNHETDLLAALFQLCHAPIKKTESKVIFAFFLFKYMCAHVIIIQLSIINLIALFFILYAYFIHSLFILILCILVCIGLVRKDILIYAFCS